MFLPAGMMSGVLEVRGSSSDRTHYSRVSVSSSWDDVWSIEVRGSSSVFGAL